MPHEMKMTIVLLCGMVRRPHKTNQAIIGQINSSKRIKQNNRKSPNSFLSFIKVVHKSTMTKQSLSLSTSSMVTFFLVVLLILASPVLSALSKEQRRLRSGVASLVAEKGPKHRVLQRGLQGVPSIVEGQLGRIPVDLFEEERAAAL
jgi:hypothetical protein